LEQYATDQVALVGNELVQNHLALTAVAHTVLFGGYPDGDIRSRTKKLKDDLAVYIEGNPSIGNLRVQEYVDIGKSITRRNGRYWTDLDMLAADAAPF